MAGSPGGTQDVTEGTAYCVAENCGDVSSDNDGVGDSRDDGTGLTVLLSASNTVSMGTMQVPDDVPTFGSEQGVCVAKLAT